MKNVKRLLMLTLAYCMLVTQVFAAGYDQVDARSFDMNIKGDHAQMIKTVFDKYRYRMTVEWDQADPTFKAYAKSELEKDLMQLNSYGVSLRDIQTFMTATLLDGQTRSDYEALVATLKRQGKTEEQVAKAAGQFMEKNYNQGASYSGGASRSWAGVAVVIAIIVVVVVTVIVIRDRNDDDDDGDEDPCDYDLTKNWGGGNDDCCFGGFGKNFNWDPCRGQ